MDQEILKAFSDEIQAIATLLGPIAEQLRNQTNQPKLFEEYGQVIDRIYGTAATLGYKAIADYCRSMKAICYKCSQSKDIYAMNQVKDLILVGVQLIKKMPPMVFDETSIKRIQYTLQKEREKAEELSKKVFGNMRASVA